MSDNLDPRSTALLIIEPQNDFLSEGGVVWDLLGKGGQGNKGRGTSGTTQAGVPVFYSPHYYTENEFKS
jgi:nicotinamidase-related amidase